MPTSDQEYPELAEQTSQAIHNICNYGTEELRDYSMFLDDIHEFSNVIKKHYGPSNKGNNRSQQQVAYKLAECLKLVVQHHKDNLDIVKACIPPIMVFLKTVSDHSETTRAIRSNDKNKNIVELILSTVKIVCETSDDETMHTLHENDFFEPLKKYVTDPDSILKKDDDRKLTLGTLALRICKHLAPYTPNELVQCDIHKSLMAYTKKLMDTGEQHRNLMRRSTIPQIDTLKVKTKGPRVPMVKCWGKKGLNPVEEHPNVETLPLLGRTSMQKKENMQTKDLLSHHKPGYIPWNLSVRF